ncbi:MAG: hypothetical protein ACRCXK_04110 [Wohlfahrtiimonas sp.]
MLLFIILISGCSDYYAAEKKVEEICEKIQLGDTYNHVLQIMTESLDGIEMAEVTEHTEDSYSYIVSTIHVKAILPFPRYICTAKLSDAIVIEKFSKFLD